jgi:hypothetical protein
MSAVRLRRRPDVLWRRSLDAVVLLPPDADDVVTVAGTGPAVWEMLADWRTKDDLVATLSAAFDASEAEVEADLEPLLAQLTALGAVEAAADSGGSAPE